MLKPQEDSVTTHRSREHWQKNHKEPLMKHRAIRSLIICLVASGSSIAAAQTRPALPVLEEILVTAQKREQSLMDVPVSVIAVGGDKIDDSSIASLDRK